MVTGLARGVTTALRGIGAAVRARPVTVLGVVGAVLALHVFLPPLVLAVARGPWTYFAFNPWLTRLPEYLASSTPLEQKLDFLSRVALPERRRPRRAHARRRPARLAGRPRARLREGSSESPPSLSHQELLVSGLSRRLRKEGPHQRP